jgi:hypothetical protein
MNYYWSSVVYCSGVGYKLMTQWTPVPIVYVNNKQLKFSTKYH